MDKILKVFALFIVFAGFSSSSFAANEARFNQCRSKLVMAQKLGLLEGLDYKNTPPSVTVGKTFYNLPFDAKTGFIEEVNCFLNQGDPTYINFNIIDWRTGKKIGQYSWGKLKLD